MGEIRNRKGGGRKKWVERVESILTSKKSEILLTLRGKSEGVGNGGTKEVRTDTHAPVPKPPAASEAVSSPEGLRAELSKACETPGLTMTLLGLQRLSRSEDRQAARSWCRFADWAEVFGRGDEVQSAWSPQPLPALRVAHSAGAAATRARTGPSCSPGSRLLSTGSARPGRSWPPALWLSPV